MNNSGHPSLPAVRTKSRPIAESGEFERAFGEPLSQALDLETWILGEDLAAAYGRIEEEVASAVAQEGAYRKVVREAVFPHLGSAPGAPRNAGVYQARPEDLERIHTGLLFNGGVEACDGACVVHDTIPLTITQIGVCLVSYNGQQGSWAHRLFRRDLRARIGDPVDEVLAILERRERREGQGQGGDALSDLARRGVMAYAERSILREKSSAPWRMGHGSPVPFELLTEFWAADYNRIQVSLDLMRWYVLEHKRFVFVPSAPRRRHLLTIGNVLKPLEFAIVQTLQPDIERHIETGPFRDENRVRPAMREFCEEVGSQVVVGLYRVWEAAPAYVFYAHVEHAELAAHIAMADSLLQQHRGFPMLIDLADTVCRTTFGAESLIPSVQTAYAAAGEPFRYLAERETRYHV